MKNLRGYLFSVLFLGLILITSGCKNEKSTEPILVSKDSCHYCKMVYTDKRFGAEFVTNKGKVYKFDAVECMGHFLEEHKEIQGKAYVVDSFHESKLIPFKEAKFMHDPAIRSPMGKGIFASENAEELKTVKPQNETVIQAEEVLKLIGRPEISEKL